MDSSKETIKVGAFYTHFKTKNLYKVIGIGKHSETLEPLVVYEAQYDNTESKLWCRPLEEFTGEVERDGVTHKRFTLVQ
jgi:hypothetical protein